MPERSTIHSWLVSIICTRSWLLTLRAGTCVPRPRMRARGWLMKAPSYAISNHVDRHAGVRAEPIDQLVAVARRRRPDSAGGLAFRQIERQARRGFAEHLRGRAVARIAIAVDLH